MEERMNKLEWKRNQFGGVVVSPESVVSCEQYFTSALQSAIKQWLSEKCKVVWLEVPDIAFSILPKACEEGFIFHHACKNYAMLTLELEEGAFVPPYATHYIGIGGVVINSSEELLVVSERYRRAGQGPSYKLPGGALQAGEHLAEAAVREVFEETGVKTTFDSISFFRHWHGYRYGMSDIYFVAKLIPTTKKITMQEEEISECFWMPVADFLNNDFVHDFNKAIVNASIQESSMQKITIHGYEPPEKYEFFSVLG
ncbi:MAG: hypothetical protein CL781_00665 [Chloroflexi bacterium]|nr:hypothetical protein [Chloroflexota bacterium]|tara:strand:+ start:156 stop:923 length:768 start_codon:yes stop_codon:yes gene_type:complete